MTHMDCELIRATDPATGETIEAIRVPAGYTLVLIPDEMAERHADWRECAAVRIVRSEDGTVGSIEVTDDLDWLTSEDGPHA